MTGSSAAALTGLMFIVITLVTGVDRLRRNPDGVSAFSTPTVVHFCAAFLVSAVLCAPWNSVVAPAVVLGIAAVVGVAYALRITIRQKRVAGYDMDVEDWLCYTLLPLLAYTALLVSAILVLTPSALYAVAGAVVLLILIGIHNAWDVVTFIAVNPPKDPPSQ